MREKYTEPTIQVITIDQNAIAADPFPSGEGAGSCTAVSITG